MNCKQGDLAVVVRSVCGNEGKIVRCLRYVRGMELGIDGCWHECDIWETDTVMPGWTGALGKSIADSQLRPIRDQDGEDETLTWAGKPQEVTA